MVKNDFCLRGASKQTIAPMPPISIIGPARLVLVQSFIAIPPSRKYQKAKYFQTFSGGIEMKHWAIYN